MTQRKAPETQGVVYKVNCLECSSIYIVMKLEESWNENRIRGAQDNERNFLGCLVI